MQIASWETRIPAGVGRPYLYIRRPASDLVSQKKSNFPEWLQFLTRYGDAAISNVRINIRLRYGNSAHVDVGCRQQCCVQNWDCRYRHGYV